MVGINTVNEFERIIERNTLASLYLFVKTMSIFKTAASKKRKGCFTVKWHVRLKN
jgi:hypothetical protein